MGMMFQVSTGGTPKMVGTRLIHTGEKVREMKPVMDLIFVDMLLGNEANIRSGGVRGGGSYAQLKPSTLKKKGSAEILYTTGAKPNYSKIGGDALVNSVTQLGARFQIRRVTNTEVSLGTKRPNARSHQYGNPSRNIPSRPFLQMTQHDVNRWNGWITAKLMEAVRVK